MLFRSNLEKILKAGHMAITCELSPPKNASIESIRKKARLLKGVVDAVNITDCQVANVRLASWAGCIALLTEGVEPILQMTCRDRNRIAMQADLLGAWALGIRNLFCTTGDHPRFGNHPEAKPVFDLDSVQLLQMVSSLKEGKFLNGEEIKGERPNFFLGATENPFADPFEYRVRRLAKKIRAGAEFIQTQVIYDTEKFKRFMQMAYDESLTEKAYILAGIIPPKSLRMIEYIKERLPGSCVPEVLVKRMRQTRDQREEGIKIAVELINEIKEIPGVKGFHIMAMGMEEAIVEILKQTGFYPRPLVAETRDFHVLEVKKEGVLSREVYEELERLKAQVYKLETMIKGESFTKEEKPISCEIFPKEQGVSYRSKEDREKLEKNKRITRIYRPLDQRLTKVPKDWYLERYTGKIREVEIGVSSNLLKIGGAETLPFHSFEGDPGKVPVMAMEVLDVVPEDYPQVLGKYFSDVWDDPGSWAKKCVEEYGAEAICVHLLGTDPNYLDLGEDHAKKVVDKVLKAVEVPIIVWGCDNAEKDTQILKALGEILKEKGVLIGPVVEDNYRTLGAVALGYGLPVIASSPIDVNIAKQLNILLENLGIPLERIIMDPSVGALGYGLEYTYSVMERIRLAALTANDTKLQNPFICNVGREVWKTKEATLPSDEVMGEEELRGITMETITALSLILAGGELLILRHPRSLRMIKETLAFFVREKIQ